MVKIQVLDLIERLSLPTMFYLEASVLQAYLELLREIDDFCLFQSEPLSLGVVVCLWGRSGHHWVQGAN